MIEFFNECGIEKYDLLLPPPTPMANGGEGTNNLLIDSLQGELNTANVTDPLGRQIEAS